MPTYEYRCSNCKKTCEYIQKITADPITTCPDCQQETLQRGPGGGIGLQFKGEGFYINDYSKSDCKPKDDGKQGESSCCLCDKS